MPVLRQNVLKGDAVQTTLLGLAIAFIMALMAVLIGPYFIDWNQFRPQFEAEATRVIGAPVRVVGALDARLLPTPALRLRSVVVGGANDLGKVRADKLDVEFSLGSLMRGEWRADELTINGLSLDLGLDRHGRIDWPASAGKLNLGSLSIDRLNLTGRIALHDAASRGTLELNDIAFSGDVRSLVGSVRGEGTFMLSGTRYPFRVASAQSVDGSGTHVHLSIDAGASALSADLEGLLFFEARAPRFDGAIVLAVPAGLKAQGDIKGEVSITPWQISAKIKADPAAAQLDQLEVSYGPEERALKFAGMGNVRFGAWPLLHVALSARQLDVDRFAGVDNSSAGLRLLPGLHALIDNIPRAPIPMRMEVDSEQIMLGGRPVQSFAADLSSNAQSWTIERLHFRAPGATLVSLTGREARVGQSGHFRGVLNVESSDPDGLLVWLQGQGEVAYRSQKPFRLRGNIGVAGDHFTIEAMKAEIDGNAIEGRVSLSNQSAGAGSRVEAELKGERVDLDAAMAFAHSFAGPRDKWPTEAKLSLDISRATLAGQELPPFMAKLGYGPNTIFIDQLKIGEASGVVVEGAGAFDRANSAGRLVLNSSAASLAQITEVIAPFAPMLALRLHSTGPIAGPAHLKLTLDIDKSQHTDRADARAMLDLDTPQFKSVTTIVATPEIEALRRIDLDTLRRSEFRIESKLSSERGGSLLVLLGLDHAIAVGDSPAQFECSVTGTWHSPLQLKARLSGIGLDAEAQGTVESWTQDARANFNLNMRSVNLAPLFDLKSTDPLAWNISLSSRVTFAGIKLTFDDLDSAISGSQLRGRVALTFGDERSVQGEIGLDSLDLAPMFALAIGAAGHDVAEPLGSGLLKGWRGRLAFQALRGVLPGGGELSPVSGMVRNDGQSLTFDAIKGGIGGGEASANIDARQNANGIALSARVQFSGVDGAALRYRSLAMPAGHMSMQMTLESQGRSASALTGALTGSGTVILESARIAGLDPRAFDAAIHASDNGQAVDDVRLRQIVEQALSIGALSIKPAEIPFIIRDGRFRVGATTLEADGARAIISGGYDIPADQADIRTIFALTTAAAGASRAEIQLFATGTPDALSRTVDVAALSSWLAVRAIDRETRRLDSIERGEPPLKLPASIPSLVATPESSAPVVGKQVAPLPPPIEIRPPPSVVLQPPNPKPPRGLTPPVALPR